MKKFAYLFLLVNLFCFYSMAQDGNLTIEIPVISAGAEYSIYLQNLINSGMDKQLEFNGNLPSLNKLNSIAAITTYEGINFDENAALNGSYFIPPDPIGAAGPNHLVSVVNCAIEWFTKVGVTQNSQRLGRNSGGIVGSFFESLGPSNATFDPKVIYDQNNGRFVVITLEQQSNPQSSRILIAVSQTSNPNDGWYFHSINSLLNITGNCWADYPGLAAGTDAIYITANMFRFSGGGYAGSRLWIINKTPFYTGGTASVTVHNPYPSGQATTYQPAQIYGTPPTTVGTFLVAYSGLSNGTNEFCNTVTVINPTTNPSFNFQQISLGNIDNTGGSYLDAPQLGTLTLINTNDRRTQNAVWRNNFLWTTFTVVPNIGTSAGQVTAHWLKINTTTLNALTVDDQGDIGGEDIATGTYTFFPSIAANSAGDVIIGFSASAPTIYPGAYYAARYSSTPAGTVLPTQTFKLGLDYYIRQFGGSQNRWGDYSGSCVDPSDDLTFYIFNQYALTRGTILPQYPTQDGRWGTAFGVVPTSALPVELSSFTAKVLRSGGVKLDWRTETEVNNYGFEVERSQMSEVNRQTEWQKLGFVEGNGNSNSPKTYSFTDNNAYYGKYAYRLKQIDTDGQFEYSDIVEVDAGNIPEDIVLEQNYPNPFNPKTTIKFALAESQQVLLKVNDIIGNEVSVLFDGQVEANKVYEREFDAADLSTGIYFYRLETENRVENRKMLLLK